MREASPGELESQPVLRAQAFWPAQPTPLQGLLRLLDRKLRRHPSIDIQSLNLSLVGLSA